MDFKVLPVPGRPRLAFDFVLKCQVFLSSIVSFLLNSVFPLRKKRTMLGTFVPYTARNFNPF